MLGECTAIGATPIAGWEGEKANSNIIALRTEISIRMLLNCVFYWIGKRGKRGGISWGLWRVGVFVKIPLSCPGIIKGC